jgi:hypothetical protein
MEEELGLNEEQSEEVVGDITPTDEVTPADEVTAPTIGIDEDTQMSTIDESSSSSNDTTYIGDEESTTTKASDAPSDDKWGSCDCRSECKYNTGDSSKYANYGYSD